MSQGQQRQEQKPAAATAAAKPAATEFSDLLNKPIKYRAFAEDREIALTGGQVKRFIAKPTKKGQWPGDADIVQFMKLCEARQLDPWVGDAFLVGYDSNDGPVFTCITAHQALLKRAEANPNFDGIEQGVIVQDKDGATSERAGDFVPPGCKLLGAWARCYRKDRKVPFYDAINVEARDKNRSQWNADKSGMIVKCAEASVLRLAFPTQLGGLYIAQEMEHLQHEPKTSDGIANEVQSRTPQKVTIDDLLPKPTTPQDATPAQADPKPVKAPARAAAAKPEPKATTSAPAKSHDAPAKSAEPVGAKSYVAPDDRDPAVSEALAGFLERIRSCTTAQEASDVVGEASDGALSDHEFGLLTDACDARFPPEDVFGGE